MRISIALVSVLGLLALQAPANAQTAVAACQLTPTVAASATTISPGEPLDLTVRFKNTAGRDISVAVPSETIGSVRVGIAGPGEPDVFKTYLGPGWGTDDAVQTPKPLAKDASIVLNLRVVYQVQRQQHYAFATVGAYRLKVRFQDSAICPAGTETPVFTIQVVAPKGDDLAVWNDIKDCARCGHFLHTGRTNRNAVSQDAVARLRSLARQYPKSRYTKFVRDQLDALDEKSRDKSKNDEQSHDD